MSNPPPSGWPPPGGGWPPPSDASPYGPPPGPGYLPPGYQPYGYGMPGYGMPGYGAMEHPQGTMILVFGILGIVLCQLFGPVAWIMGNRAMEQIDASPSSYSNRGIVNAGRICGIVGTCLMVLYFGLIILEVVVFGAFAASHGN